MLKKVHEDKIKQVNFTSAIFYFFSPGITTP
jgi:hypothetical protein